MKRISCVLIFAVILIIAQAVCFAAPKKGRAVTAEYTVSVDGKVIDSSKKRGFLNYTEGKGMVIPGLEKRLAGLRAGDTKTFDIPAAEAYGAVNPKKIKEFKRIILPKAVIPKPDTYIQIRVTGGKLILARIVEVKKDKVVLDFNRPLAGKTLHYQVKVLSVK